jgi:hypothetical protein
LNAHRRDLGESLIRLGERLGGRTQTEGASREPQQLSPDMQQASQEPHRLPSGMLRIASEANPLASSSPLRLAERLRVVSDPQPVPTETKEVVPEQQAMMAETKLVAAEPQPAAPPMQAPVLRPERSASQPAAEAVQPAGVKLEAAAAVAVVALPNSNAPASSAVTASATSTPQPSMPTNDVAPRLGARSGSSAHTATPLMSSASLPTFHIEQVRAADSGSLSEKFLEVGKFKEKVWADKTTVKLSQFGYATKVIPKNNAWKKSYQVVVGPFGTDPEAEAAHKNLVSNGFEPRSFERGTRGFRFPRTLKVAGTSVPMGDCTIRWESYMPDAIVKIESKNGGAVTAEGTWVNRGAKYGDDAVVYTKNVDGSQNLVEIRFSGMGQVLVFGKGRI